MYIISWVDAKVNTEIKKGQFTMKKTLKFYKVTDWMFAIGEGFTTCTGILALIHSFNEYGKECQVSTASMAQFCGCGRRKVFSELKYLIENGFITANRGAKTDIVGYTVNVEKCIEAAAAYAQDAQALMHEMHKPYAPDAQPYAPDAQALMHEMHTNKRGITERLKKEETREGEQSAYTRKPSPDNDADDFSLTDEQVQHIRYGFDYTSERNTRRHTADYYIELVKQYGYNKVLQFLANDTRPRSADEEQQTVEQMRMADEIRKEYEEYDKQFEI